MKAQQTKNAKELEKLTKDQAREAVMDEKNQFKRKARIGYNFIGSKEYPTFIKVLKYEEITNKKGKTNSFFRAIDLKTGEEGLIFIDGGIKGQMASLGGLEKAEGRAFELIHKGYVEADIDGETQEVNQWDIFELDLN